MTPLRVHLEGMGIVGSYLAWRLFMDDIPFTWNDTEQRIQAWRASTGAIFPSGHSEDQQALAVWRGHLDEGHFGDFMEEAAYVFCTKAPPHGGRYEWSPLAETIKLAGESSLHLNAQQWVPFTRRVFAAARKAERPPGAQVVVTHGFGPRLARFMWGWTVPVVLRTAVELERRQCLYFRRGRFVMAYAYPIPNTDEWYAGSSLLSQRVPKPLEVRPKYRLWRDTMLELGDGYVIGIAVRGMPEQGWRPVPHEGDTAWVTLEPDGRLAARPLWHSGIRHAPHIYNALLEAL